MKRKNKKIKNKLHKIYIDIYSINLYFLISDWDRCKKIFYDKFGKFNSINDIEDEVAFAIPLREKSKQIKNKLKYCYFIWINEKVDYSVLIHEVFHAVAFILTAFAELKLTDESEEAYAYLFGSIIEKINKILGGDFNKKFEEL
jgi:hypothetical protein